jgi:hypothetical protein
MDVEGRGRWLRRIEDGPVMLNDATVGGAVAKERGDLHAVTADSEDSDFPLDDGVFEELQEAVIAEVMRFGLMEKKDVDEVCAKEAEAVRERGAGFFGAELGFFGRGRDCSGSADEATLERRDSLDYRTRNAPGGT